LRQKLHIVDDEDIIFFTIFRDKKLHEYNVEMMKCLIAELMFFIVLVR